MLDQRHLAVVVAEEHAANLRHRDVRLVDQQQKVFGKVTVKRIGRRAGRTAAQGLAVVLDARTVADFLHHLEVESRAGVQAMGLQQLAVQPQPLQPLVQFPLDLVDRPP